MFVRCLLTTLNGPNAYIRNNTGRRSEILPNSAENSQTCCLIITLCCLSTRKDLNHLLTTPTIPKSFPRMFIIRIWLIVSKAALKSSSMKKVISWLSMLARISLCTLTSAVSVEWCFLEDDWLSGRRWLVVQYSINWSITAFSKVQQQTDR